MCMCLLVWRSRTVSLPRGLLFSVLLCNFVLHRVKQRRESPRRGLSSNFRSPSEFSRLNSHRTASTRRYLKQNNVHDIPCYYTEITSRVDRRIRVCDREFFLRVSSGPHKHHKYYHLSPGHPQATIRWNYPESNKDPGDLSRIRGSTHTVRSARSPFSNAIFWISSLQMKNSIELNLVKLLEVRGTTTINTSKPSSSFSS